MSTDTSNLFSDDEIKYGESVIVATRWVLIVIGLLFIAWNPSNVGSLRLQILFIFALAFANFFLQAQVLQKKPISDAVILASSVVDLVVITIIVLAQGGYESNAYLLYIPAILAFSVSFPLGLTIVVTGLWGLFYFALGNAYLFTEVPSESLALETQVLFVRMLVFAGIAFIGWRYRKVEQDRRRNARDARAALLGYLKEDGSEAFEAIDAPPPVAVAVSPTQQLISEKAAAKRASEES